MPPRLATVFGEAIRRHLSGRSETLAVAMSAPKSSRYVPVEEQQSLFGD